MSLRCEWPSCKQTHFTTRVDFVDHQEEHSTVLINAAKDEETFHCDWHGCGSGKPKMFVNLVALKKHLRQHIKKYWCSDASCSMTFARNSDLKRHIRTKHSVDRIYLCPLTTCSRNSNGFTRKDKLDEHTRKEHSNVRCTFNHCGAQILESEIDEHLNCFHSGKSNAGKHPSSKVSGIYECALPGCESTTSKFNAYSALSHLRTNHLMSYDGSLTIFRASRPIASRGNAFVIETSNQVHRPCKTCTENSNI